MTAITQPEFLDIQKNGPITTVWLNRTQLHNAFNEQFIEELTDTFNDLDQDAHVRAVILAAKGKSFCAGADLQWMKKMIDYSFDENIEDARGLARMLQAVRKCRKPVIGRVQGAAYGGGVGLLACCDMVACVETATFALTEVKLGLLPAVISPFVLEKIGPAHASRYFLTAERFDSNEARRIGLVCEVLGSDGEMDDWIHQSVDLLIANAPGAVSTCKTMIRQVMGADWETAETITSRLIAERRVSEEGQEGIRAFMEKRPPAWTRDYEGYKPGGPSVRG